MCNCVKFEHAILFFRTPANTLKFILSWLVVYFLSLAPSMAAEYKLDVQDKLRVYVAEWPILNVELSVGANGSVALPLIGEVQARGLEPAQLAAAVAEKLKLKANQRQLPDVSIDVVGYRPFYILGSVTSPGEYAFRPEMLVLNAMSIAGGAYRAVGYSEWDLARTSINGVGELNVAELRKATLLAEQVRYEAEVGERGFPPTPPDAAPSYARALDEQRELFAANNNSYENQAKTLGAMVELHKTEIASIAMQLETVSSKLAEYQVEVEKATRLENSGLATNRRLPLQRDLFDIQREQRLLEFEKVRAERAVQEALLRIETLGSTRKTAAQEGLQRARSMMREIDEQLTSLSQLVTGAALQTEQFKTARQREELPRLQFTIIRGRDAQMQQISATEVTPILPGDIIKVELSGNKSM